MNVGQVSGIWASATTSIAPPTPGLSNFTPAPTLAPIGGGGVSPFAALSASAQSALLQAQEHGQPRP